jgi:acetoin utilization protein AcuB
MRASSTMTRDVVCVPPELPLARAWAVMGEMRIRHLPVVQHGKLVGLVSDRDVLLRAVLEDDGKIVVDQGVVGEAMSLHPWTCHAATSVSAIAQLMIDHKIDAVPVVAESDRTKVTGLVTSTDLLWLLIGDNNRVLPLEFTVKTASSDGVVAAA